MFDASCLVMFNSFSTETSALCEPLDINTFSACNPVELHSYFYNISMSVFSKWGTSIGIGSCHKEYK
jgi:hypothetical protein